MLEAPGRLLAQAEAAEPRDVESAIVTELALGTLVTDDQKETAVEGNEVAHGEANEEPLPQMKKARARKTTEENSRLRTKKTCSLNFIHPKGDFSLITMKIIFAAATTPPS